MGDILISSPLSPSISWNQVSSFGLLKDCRTSSHLLPSFEPCVSTYDQLPAITMGLVRKIQSGKALAVSRVPLMSAVLVRASRRARSQAHHGFLIVVAALGIALMSAFSSLFPRLRQPCNTSQKSHPGHCCRR